MTQFKRSLAGVALALVCLWGVAACSTEPQAASTSPVYSVDLAASPEQAMAAVYDVFSGMKLGPPNIMVADTASQASMAHKQPGQLQTNGTPREFAVSPPEGPSYSVQVQPITLGLTRVSIRSISSEPVPQAPIVLRMVQQQIESEMARANNLPTPGAIRTQQ